MKFVNAIRKAVVNVLLAILLVYVILVGVPALLVFLLALWIVPKTEGKPKLTPEQVTEKIKNITRLLKETGLDDRMKVDAQANIQVRARAS